MNATHFQVHPLAVDLFKLDGGAMFGVVPKALWERACPADDANRIAMGCQCLLLQNEHRTVLIDAGLGNKWDPKGQAMYQIADAPGEVSTLETALARHQVTPEQVTDVVVTHLHFDHAGGLTKREPDGTLAPVFANARHWVQAEHLDWALSPTEKDRGSFPSENIEPLVRADLFSLTRGEEELFTGVGVVPLNGHTKAMQGVLIDGPQKIFYPADLLPMRAHLHLPYIMAYDIEPLTTLAEKKHYLAQAVKENWLLFLEHEHEFAIGRVEMFGGKYTLGME